MVFTYTGTSDVYAICINFFIIFTGFYDWTGLHDEKSVWEVGCMNN